MTVMCDRISIIRLRAPNNVDSYRNAPAVTQFLTQCHYVVLWSVNVSMGMTIRIVVYHLVVSDCKGRLGCTT
jgi:hypothetical protein